MLSRLAILPLLSAFVLLLASCASPPAAHRNPAIAQRSQSLATLGYSPIELQKLPGDSRYSGEFLVNGAPVRFLIDSGANSTDLDARLSKKLGIKTNNSIEVVSRGALGRPVSARVGLGSLTAGTVTASPFPFMIAPHSDRHTATSRYDGQLGLDALSGLGALVDLSNGKMWVPSHQSHMTPGSQIRPLGRHKSSPSRPTRLAPPLPLVVAATRRAPMPRLNRCHCSKAMTTAITNVGKRQLEKNDVDKVFISWPLTHS